MDFHNLTVGELTALLSTMDSDATVVASCCQGAEGHAIKAGTLRTEREDFDIMPSIHYGTDGTKYLLLTADYDYVTFAYDDEDED
jgi:hypothetical protein